MSLDVLYFKVETDSLSSAFFYGMEFWHTVLNVCLLELKITLYFVTDWLKPFFDTSQRAKTNILAHFFFSTF